MQTWKIVMAAGRLKETQEAMLKEGKQIQDVILELEEEASKLSDLWKGAAAETFFSQFLEEMENTKNYAEKIGKLITLLSQAEQKFKQCEESVKEGIEFG